MKLLGSGNELRLNEATMIGVVQTWLDNQQYVRNDGMPLVTGVKWREALQIFVIDLAQKPKDPPKA